MRAVSNEHDLQSSVNNFINLLVGDKISGNAEIDSNTRLQEVAGVIIGAQKDYSADTGAISGSNAGGSQIKNAADIVPESGDLSTATLPEPVQLRKSHIPAMTENLLFLVSSANVMLGYWKNILATKDESGRLHTGDIVKLTRTSMFS